MAFQETAFLNLFFELLPAVAFAGVLKAEIERFLIDIVLNLLEEFADMLYDAVDGARLFGERVAASNLYGAVFQIASTDSQTNGHTAELVFSKLKAGGHVVSRIDLHADAELLELVSNGVNLLEDSIELVGFLEDRHDSHLDRCEMGRQDEAVIVGMRHDERTHQASGNAPRGSPYVLLLVLFVEESDVKRLGEVLSEEMRGSGLQRFAILHHCFDAVGVERTGETFVGRLHALDYGDSHHALCKISIYIEHFAGIVFGFLFAGMSRVALLPKEFCRTEEKTCTHLPSHYVAPLIAQDWQVAIRGNPVLIRGPDDGLGGRTDDQLFLQSGIGINHYPLAVGVVHQAVVRHHCAFLGKTLHVLCLTA